MICFRLVVVLASSKHFLRTSHSINGLPSLSIHPIQVVRCFIYGSSINSVNKFLLVTWSQVMLGWHFSFCNRWSLNNIRMAFVCTSWVFIGWLGRKTSVYSVLIFSCKVFWVCTIMFGTSLFFLGIFHNRLFRHGYTHSFLYSLNCIGNKIDIFLSLRSLVAN